jgi:hypothetical protein
MSLTDPPKIIACDTLRDEIRHIVDGHLDLEVELCEGLLHDYPDRLRATVQERIDATPGERTILLCYGRCSNGLTGLHARGHRLVLPAVDDCISLLLGSRETYLRQFAEHPGTYYYTRGWIDYLEDTYQVYLKLIPKYGEERARKLALMELANYTRLAIIDTGTYPLAEYEPYVYKVGAFFDLPVEHLPGSLRLIEKLVAGPHDDEFFVVEPGETLDESRFWALPGV